MAAGPDSGEDISDHDDPQVTAGDAAITNDGEHSGQPPAAQRAGSPSHKRKVKSTPHRNYRSHADRLVLSVYTRPIEPRELRQRERLDYSKVNNGGFAGIRTISSVKAHYEPKDLTEPEIIDLATTMARDLKSLEVDDSTPQALTELTIARIYRISALLERYVPVEDIGDDSISA